MTKTDIDPMEDIREIAFGCTLKEAFDAGICIQCHCFVGGELSYYTSQETDNWLIEGLCPSCYTKSTTIKSTPILRLAR